MKMNEPKFFLSALLLALCLNCSVFTIVTAFYLNEIKNAIIDGKAENMCEIPTN